jgi:uncharacterized protein YjbI with pentapeptide repeats
MPLSWEQCRTTSLRWVAVVNLATMNFPLQASAILGLLTTATVASTAAATPNACFLRYLLASKACPNCRLGSNLDLAEANFQGADLIEANLERAILTGADLSGAYLVGANLPQANLRGANLSGSDLEGADLRGADLRGANLSSTSLYGADLRGADLRMPTWLELTCALPAPKAHAFRVLSGSSAKSSL